MSDAIAIVERLLRDSVEWRKQFKSQGRAIEAAGASIRIKAMQDVLADLHSHG